MGKVGHIIIIIIIIVITIKDLDTCKTLTCKTLYKKITWTKIPPYRGLPQAIIYPETEGFAVAIQDRAIKTRNYEKQ
jgi:hypothetical protein